MLHLFTLNIIAFLITLNLLTSQAYSLGKWGNTVLIDSEEQAKAFARAKADTYAAITDKKIDKVLTFVRESYPDYNAHIISFGLHDFFHRKQRKWNTRTSLTSKEAYKEVQSSIAKKELFKFGPESLGNWEKILNEAISDYENLFLQHYTIKALEKILDTEHSSLGQLKTGEQPSRQYDALAKHASRVTILSPILKSMKIDHEIDRIKNIYSFLTEHIKKLIGASELPPPPETSKGAVVGVIDPYFNGKYIPNPEKMTVNFEKRPTYQKWEQGKYLHETVEGDYYHGDKMYSLIKALAKDLPTSFSIHGIFYSTTGESAFDGNRPAYYASLNLPTIFNCSFIPPGVHYYLEQTDQGEIKLDSNTDDARKHPDHFKSCISKLAEAFPNRQAGEFLSEEHIQFLQKVEDEDEHSKKAPELAKRLVKGPNNDQIHIIIASPCNNSGPLVKKKFHNGWIKLLSDPEIEDHALVALNYDFCKEDIAEGSHTAGEYQDIAVLVPARYLIVFEDQSPLPHTFAGGHSSATAILSASTATVRFYYPDLSHREVKRAILEGANKDFKGYSLERHGQGMLNLKRSLEIAASINQAKKEEAIQPEKAN